MSLGEPSSLSFCTGEPALESLACFEGGQPVTIPYAAFIRHERKQAERFALMNAKIEDAAGPDFVLGFPPREIVKLCDQKIEMLQWMHDLIKERRRRCAEEKRKKR
jgi:hypothetical protein